MGSQKMGAWVFWVFLWVIMGIVGTMGIMGILYLPSILNIPNIPSIPTIRHNATETTIETNLFILTHFYWKNKCFR